jgi:predicted esterase
VIAIPAVLGLVLCSCDDGSTDADADAGADAATDTDTDTDSDTGEPEAESGIAWVPETDIEYGYLVPPSYDPAVPTPVLYSLHPYGGAAVSMIHIWHATAVEHGFIVLTLKSQATTWTWPVDSDRFHQMVEHTDTVYNVDPSRRYLHGYSAGAHYSYALGLADNQFFAAFAVFAGSMEGAIQVEIWPLDYDGGDRRIPACIHHSVDDFAIPFADAVAAKEELEAAGHEVFFGELEGSGHSYDEAASPEVWEFVSQFAL